MQTMEQALCDLVLRGTVSREVAIESSSFPEQLVGLLERTGAASGSGTPLASTSNASGLRLAGS
jgi:hypothetical protein